MEIEKVLNALSAPLPEESIQRTKGAETKKGYNTTGHGYQYIVDRFNDVLGDKWGYEWRILDVRQGEYSNGRIYHEITVETHIWIIEKDYTRSCVGGHMSSLYADALKGAITNSFKKTSAFWGVGADAYRGDIDDDNKPLPVEPGRKTEKERGDFAAAEDAMRTANTLDDLKSVASRIKNNYAWTSDESEKLGIIYAEVKEAI